MKINKKSIVKNKELSKIIHQTKDFQEWTNSYQLVRDYRIKSNIDNDIYINVETLQASSNYPYPVIDTLLKGFKRFDPITKYKTIILEGRAFIVLYEEAAQRRGLFLEDIQQFLKLYGSALNIEDCQIVDNYSLIYKRDDLILINVLNRSNKEEARSSEEAYND